MADSKFIGQYDKAKLEEAIEVGDIYCTPLNKKSITKSGIKLTIGNYFYRSNPTKRVLYNPYQTNSINQHFEGPFRVQKYSIWSEQNSIKLGDGISEDHPIITISPGESIICHSHEFIGLIPSLRFTIKPSSFWSLNGLQVTAADDGFPALKASRVTLLIYNQNPHETILIPVGDSIVTMIVTRVSEDNTSPRPIESDNQIKKWSPEMMLPSVNGHKVSLPLGIEEAVYE